MGSRLVSVGDGASSNKWAEIEQSRDSNLWEVEGKILREYGLTE